jgi:hypothetical protein
VKATIAVLLGIIGAFGFEALVSVFCCLAMPIGGTHYRAKFWAATARAGDREQASPGALE